MANIALYRGGSPDFKGWFCDGDYSQFHPPFSSPDTDYTPPFNSHADGAHGQGYLNLHFPLVPNLAGTTGHDWMLHGLKNVKAIGDIIQLAWVPLRSYLDSFYLEPTIADPELAGVAVAPVAQRVTPDFSNPGQAVYAANTAFDDVIADANVQQIDLGSNTITPYLVAFCDTAAKKKSTFGHNIIRFADSGNPSAGWDNYFGAVMLGLEITEGATEKIAKLYKGNFALYMSAKLLTFEGSTQVG